MSTGIQLVVHPRRHSPLGGSVIDRILECPGSLALAKQVPPKRASGPMLEGTAAHRLAEYRLQYPHVAVASVDIMDAAFASPIAVIAVTTEMETAVKVYTDEVNAIVKSIGAKAQVFIEEEVACKSIHAEAFGSIDCYILDPVHKKVYILDYKHGMGKRTDAAMQMAFYGIGVLEKHPGYETIECIAVQPRYFGDRDEEFRGIRSSTWTADELRDLAKGMSSRAKMAMAALSGGEAQLATGSHCEWCPAAGICPKQHEEAQKTAALDFAGEPKEEILTKIESLTPEQKARVVLHAKVLRDWLEAVEKSVMDDIMQGKPNPLLKVVRGKPGNREWANPANVETDLTIGGDLTADQIYEKKLISPTTAEKLLGGKKAAEKILAPLVTRKEGKLVVVSVSDKRPAVDNLLQAAQDFADAPDFN